MKKHFSFICMIALTLWLGACNNAADNAVEKADSANDAKTDSTDNKISANSTDEASADFMVKAANGGMMEVELGKAAQQKAKSKEVKDFAEMMVRDHTTAGNELKALARQKNVTLPDSVSGNHRDHIIDISKKTGNDFDKAYMDQMVDDHQSTYDMFKDVADNCKDPEVKAWAAKTLPTLQTHLDTAKAIANRSIKK
jgi:putative membrane protein